MGTLKSLLFLAWAGSAATACGIAGIPNFSKKDRFHEVPPGPIVTEGKTDSPDSAATDDTGGETSQKVEPKLTGCEVAAASQKTDVTGFQNDSSVVIEKSALVAISSTQGSVNVSVNKATGTLCITNTGLQNTIEVLVTQPIDYLELGSSSGQWRVRVAQGAVIKSVQATAPGLGVGTLTFYGPGSYPCPKLNNVACN